MTPAVVCTPLRIEQAAVRGLRAVHTGLGPRRSAAARLPAGPRIVVGLGGGLTAAVRPGDVVVASEVLGPREPVPASADSLAEALRRLGLTVHIGPILSCDHLVRERERSVLAGTGALAVDMESAWLASGAEPFAVVRAIVDTAGQPLRSPATFRHGWTGLRSLRRAVPALAGWAEEPTSTLPREVR